eukprot:gb/GECH01013699.1/.p1 GENE.gb/GECH01013699.1/~~gb/GECH01013699.1/.p1  ORF type:complete len:217 (+),score=41.44 gb/GECH01013699.1/:1-651(+)
MSTSTKTWYHNDGIGRDTYISRDPITHDGKEGRKSALFLDDSQLQFFKGKRQRKPIKNEKQNDTMLLTRPKTSSVSNRERPHRGDGAGFYHLPGYSGHVTGITKGVGKSLSRVQQEDRKKNSASHMNLSSSNKDLTLGNETSSLHKTTGPKTTTYRDGFGKMYTSRDLERNKSIPKTSTPNSSPSSLPSFKLPRDTNVAPYDTWERNRTGFSPRAK